MSHFGSSAEAVAEYGKGHGQKAVKPTLSGALQVLPHLTTKESPCHLHSDSMLSK